MASTGREMMEPERGGNKEVVNIRIMAAGLIDYMVKVGADEKALERIQQGAEIAVESLEANDG